MKRLFILYKRDIIVSLLVTTLGLWAVTATVMGLKKQDKTILIKVTNDDVRIIDTLSQTEQVQQEVSFLRFFLTLMYNYDFLSFEENVQKASFIMTDEFWLKTESEMKQSKESILQKKIMQSTVIEKISRTAPNEFEIIAQTSISKEGNRSDHKIKIKVSLKKAQRTIQNAWGMEVANASEERIL